MKSRYSPLFSQTYFLSHPKKQEFSCIQLRSFHMSHGNYVFLNKSRIFNRYKQHKYADSIKT